MPLHSFLFSVFGYPDETLSLVFDIFNNQTRSTFGFASWAIDPWPLRAKGLIVLVSPNQSDRKSNNKVSKCKLKKHLFGNKTKEFCYSTTITNSRLTLVAQPIKLQDLNQSTSWLIIVSIIELAHIDRQDHFEVTQFTMITIFNSLAIVAPKRETINSTFITISQLP